MAIKGIHCLEVVFFWAGAQKIGTSFWFFKKNNNKIRYIIMVRLLLIIFIRKRIKIHNQCLYSELGNKN